MTTDSIGQGYTLKEAADKLKVSVMTVRRRIKEGKIKAKIVQGKFGEEYRIEDLTGDSTSYNPPPAQDYAGMIIRLENRLEQLNQEVGYWRARSEAAEGEVKLLKAPEKKQDEQDRPPWWRRLFPIHKRS